MAKNILVVDDEANITRLIRMNLERQGYSVTTAEDGRHALEQVAATKPDLILLDIMMPHLDGFEVLQKLKEDPATSNVPVIMLTVKAQDTDFFEGHKRGADVYLTKPIDPAELVAHVRNLLGETS